MPLTARSRKPSAAPSRTSADSSSSQYMAIRPHSVPTRDLVGKGRPRSLRQVADPLDFRGGVDQQGSGFPQFGHVPGQALHQFRRRHGFRSFRDRLERMFTAIDTALFR